MAESSKAQIDLKQKCEVEALRDSLRQCRILFEQAEESIVVTDKHRNILYINPAFEKLTGYKREEVLGKNSRFLHSARHDAAFFRTIYDALDRGEVWNGRITNRNKSGRDYIASARFSPVRGEGGEIVEYVSVERDVTREVGLEKRLYQAQKMEALGTLVAGVAHEINNPINLILLNIPLLQKVWEDFQPVLAAETLRVPGRKYGGLDFEFLRENLGQLLSDMDMAANRVAKIVGDLKHFASPSDTEERVFSSLNRAVDNALRLGRTTLQKSGVAVNASLFEELPPVWASPHYLEQICLNLLINASQAMDGEPGEIRIETRRDDSESRVILEVADDGRGIDPAIADKIFDPFVTDRQAEGGTGLGLSITYSLVRAQGGEISFTSDPGKGTTFTVSFPTDHRKEKPRILLAEDDPLVRQALGKALGRNGSYRVEEASDGVEVCIKLGAHRPDLLILDIYMPHMDGLEVCKKIGSTPELADTKVLIITGFPEGSKVQEAVKLGFTRVCSKPIPIRQFLETVDGILYGPPPGERTLDGPHPG